MMAMMMMMMMMMVVMMMGDDGDDDDHDDGGVARVGGNQLYLSMEGLQNFHSGFVDPSSFLEPNIEY